MPAITAAARHLGGRCPRRLLERRRQSMDRKREYEGDPRPARGRRPSRDLRRLSRTDADSAVARRQAGGSAPRPFGQDPWPIHIATMAENFDRLIPGRLSREPPAPARRQGATRSSTGTPPAAARCGDRRIDRYNEIASSNLGCEIQEIADPRNRDAIHAVNNALFLGGQAIEQHDELDIGDFK